MVSVIIPSYRRPQSLERCIRSVHAAAAASSFSTEIIVFASGYHRNELDVVAQTGARVLTDEGRVLVSEARNRGAAVAAGELLMFLDDDNVIAPNMIAALATCLHAYPEYAVVGPVMFSGYEPDVIWCAGIKRTRLLGRTRFLTHLAEPPPALSPSEDFPNCFMVRSADFKDVGGFDARLFPMHYEEADLAARLKESNRGLATCVTSARVWHFTRAGTTGRMHLYDSERSYLNARARALFTALHRTGIEWIVYLVCGQFLFGLAYISIALATLRESRLEVARAYARGARDGLRMGLQLRKVGKREG